MDLYKKVPGPNNMKKEKSRPPTLLVMIQQCQKYGISYDMMCELNYLDLQALIIEYQIQDVKDYFKQQRKNSSNNGVEYVRGTDADFKKFIGR